jgi:hypothetical protein
MLNHEEYKKKQEDAVYAFYRKVFEHAFELAKEFPEEKDPKNITDPCNADDAIALYKSLDDLVIDLIGEDEETSLREISRNVDMDVAMNIQLQRMDYNELKEDLRSVVRGDK